MLLHACWEQAREHSALNSASVQIHVLKGRLIETQPDPRPGSSAVRPKSHGGLSAQGGLLARPTPDLRESQSEDALKHFFGGDSLPQRHSTHESEAGRQSWTHMNII